MRNVWEADPRRNYSPDYSQRMEFQAEQEQQQRILSPEAPIYDYLNLWALHRNTLAVACSDPDSVTDVFVVGPPGAGKELNSEYWLYQQLYAPRARKIIDPFEARMGHSMNYEYINTPMCNALGKQEDRPVEERITSPMGLFTDREIAISNGIMEGFLEESYQHGQRPLYRVIETVVHGYPTKNYGVEPFRASIQRAKTDPHYNVFAVYIVPTKDLQDRVIGMREAISRAATDDDLRHAFEAMNVEMDTPVEGRKEQLMKSWGNQVARKTIDDAARDDLLSNQARYSMYAHSGRTKTLSRGELERDDVRTKWLKARALYLLNHEFAIPRKIPAPHFITRVNRFIPGLTIPFYRGLGNQYAVAPIEEDAA